MTAQTEVVSNAKPKLKHGIVVIDKPAGMTSHDVVSIARRLFWTKRVGHTGTLDPDATGVLVLCLGQATRLAEYLSASRKHYVTEVRFGIETDTQDASGTTTSECDASHLTADLVSELLPRFRGAIQQVPPMVSALHYEGKRLYELARQGVTVERAARNIEIDALEMTAFSHGIQPKATLEVTCSTGTYIRTLAADIGAAAGTGAIMQTLRRTWVGDTKNHFALEDAHTLDDLHRRADAGTIWEIVLPPAAALSGWIQLTADTEQLARLRNGQPLSLMNIPITSWRNLPDSFDFSASINAPIDANDIDVKEATRVALLDDAGEIAAIARFDFEAGQLRPIKVFAA